MTEVTRTLMQVLNDAARVSLVYLVMILLMMVMMSNWVLPYFAVLKPQLILVVVFYWTLYRPGLLPYWVIFLLGVILDLANPILPVGTHAVSFLLVAGVLKPRRRMLMGQPFMMVWVAFVVAALMDLAISVVVLSAVSTVSIPVSVMALQAIGTILSFPLILMVLVGLHRLLPASRGMIAS